VPEAQQLCSICGTMHMKASASEGSLLEVKVVSYGFSILRGWIVVVIWCVKGTEGRQRPDRRAPVGCFSKRPSCLLVGTAGKMLADDD
jgi:hypothetical protein